MAKKTIIGTVAEAPTDLKDTVVEALAASAKAIAQGGQGAVKAAKRTVPGRKKAAKKVAAKVVTKPKRAAKKAKKKAAKKVTKKAAKKATKKIAARKKHR